MSSELIQRALITRIEVLESAVRRDGIAIAWGELWAMVFPGAPDTDIDAHAVRLLTEELKRRGLGNGKAGE